MRSSLDASLVFFDLQVDLATEVLKYGLEPPFPHRKFAHSQVDARELENLVQEIKKERTLKNTAEHIGGYLSVFWDNSFFDEVFPIIKQQKPGKDLYVWNVFLGIFIIIYTFFFFPRMTKQN